MSGHLVVVGTGPAGIRAVEAARAAGHTGPVTVLGAEPHTPYDRPPLSKTVLGADADGALPALREAEALAALGADIRGGAAATGLDPAARTVATTAGPVTYDALVIATGARARGLAGFTPATGALTLRGYDDALALRTMLDTARRLVVLGSGFIGSEVASAARERGIAVTIVEADRAPLARIAGPAAGAALTAVHTGAGVPVRCSARAVRPVLDGDRVAAVALADGTELPADAVFVGIGAVPATGWLTGGDTAALDLTDTGAIAVDTALATSTPGVFAAGDAAAVDGAAGGHWTSAVEQGRVAGTNAARLLAGGDDAPERFAGVPFAWSTWHGKRIQLIGETTHGREVDDGRGLITRMVGDRVIGAIGIDRPREIIRVRRELARAAAPVGR